MIFDQKTISAVGELVQAAAHQQGIVGPVEFTVLSSPPARGGVAAASADGVVGGHYDWCGVEDDYAEVTEEEFAHV